MASHYSIGDALTGLCFGLIIGVYLSHSQRLSKSSIKSKKTFFKTSALINTGVGETLTALHDSHCRLVWEPFLFDTVDGNKSTLIYELDGKKIEQEISRQFFRDGLVYYVIEKTSKSIKNIFKIESKSKYGRIMSLVSHFGTIEDANPVIGNPSILSCLKGYVESNTVYLSNHHIPMNISDKAMSDEEDEEEDEKTDPLGLTLPLGISDEKREFIIQLNAEAVKAMQEADKLATESDGWEDIKLKVNTIRGSRRKAAGGLYIVRGEGDIPRPIADISNYIQEISNKSEYDEMFESGTVIETLSPEMEICYQKYKKQGPVSSRDLCLLQRRFELEDGKVIAIAYSTSHPNCPETKFVRAHLYLGCFVMTPVSPTITHIIYMINVDIKGSIPKFIINSVQTDQALVVEKIRKNMTKI